MPQSEAYRALAPEAEWIVFSAEQGNGRDELLQMIINALPEGPRYYPEDQVTDVYVRDMAAEFIREQIMLQLRDEVPYGTAVEILEFKERDNGTTYISANIFVERDSHKHILIGKKGQQLKEIGAAARTQLEELIEGKVFLELWVKVEPKWRQNEKALKRLGYTKVE
jgi:GTP-binding protein Era